jgi:hypothetical protein
MLLLRIGAAGGCGPRPVDVHARAAIGAGSSADGCSPAAIERRIRIAVAAARSGENSARR